AGRVNICWGGLLPEARLHGNPLPSFGATAREHGSSAFCLHASAETVRFGTAAPVGLKSALGHLACGAPTQDCSCWTNVKYKESGGFLPLAAAAQVGSPTSLPGTTPSHDSNGKTVAFSFVAGMSQVAPFEIFPRASSISTTTPQCTTRATSIGCVHERKECTIMQQKNLAKIFSASTFPQGEVRASMP